MRLNFGKDDLGNDQIFDLPTKQELLDYLKIGLSNLRRCPNACPIVQLTLKAEMVFALELLLFNETDNAIIDN